MCWLISAIVNLLALVIAAICLLPLQRGTGPISLLARMDAEEGELETLMSSADTGSLDLGTVLEQTRPEPLEPVVAPVDLELVGGALENGLGGWQGGAGSGGTGGGSEYFGTIAHGNRFVYILDKSTSMNWGRSGEASSDSRFDRARYELLRSIDKLAPYQQFYVILFSNTTRRMFDDESPAPVTIPATRRNKERIRKWLEGAGVGGGTDPRQALYVAFSIAPDAIFLLSDGDFNQVRKKKDNSFEGNPEAEELVAQLNLSLIPIHTFAYEDPSSKERMENLAQLSGGDYKYIAPNNDPAERQPPPKRRRR